MGQCCPKQSPDRNLPRGYQPPAGGPGFAAVPEPGHEYEGWGEEAQPLPKMRLNALGALEPVPELPHFSNGEPATYSGHFNAGPFIQLPRSESTSTAASGMHAYTNIVVPHYNQATEKPVAPAASKTHAYANIAVPQYNRAPDQYVDGSDELTTHGGSEFKKQHQGSSPSAPFKHNKQSLTVAELETRGGRHGHSDAGKLPLPELGTPWDMQQCADGVEGRQDAMRAAVHEGTALHEEPQHSLQRRQSWTDDPFSEWRDRF